MKTSYEFVVVGCGGIGSAAVYWLSRVAQGEVLGLEQFALGHNNGASQDHSRIIRLSYHAPEYTRLTPHAYTAWSEVEAESGVQLVVRTGGIDIAPEGHERTLGDYSSAMTEASIPYEELSATETVKRFPQFRLEVGDRALYQADTGLVDPRKANATHVALARARGATVLDQTPVRALHPKGDHIEVETDAGVFTAGKVVIATDAWTNQVLRGFGVQLPLTVTQEQVTYFATPNLRDFASDRFPVWIWHGPDVFYGFPVYGEVATKAAQDLGGDRVMPHTRTFEPNPRAHERLVRFLQERIPGSLGPVLYTKTCLYTMPPDRNFVIDTLPECPQVVVALGAAHAFKFAGLIGQMLAELAVAGRSPWPIDAFTLARPAIRDPNFPHALSI